MKTSLVSNALPPTASPQQRKLHEAAAQLESVLVKQLLVSSGAFKGESSIAGSSLTQDMFADTLANSIAAAGGLGLAPVLEKSLALQQQPPTAGALEGPITSTFGERIDPINHQHSNHTGVDIGAATGTPIPAAKDGVVIAAGPRGGYGNAIEVAHADGTTTLYAHASQVTVAPGEHVNEGETVGLVGQTGRTTGPHLHLEVRKGGQFLDPQLALKTYRLRAEKSGGGVP